jgi:hypothetical protein
MHKTVNNKQIDTVVDNNIQGMLNRTQQKQLWKTTNKGGGQLALFSPEADGHVNPPSVILEKLLQNILQCGEWMGGVEYAAGW